MNDVDQLKVGGHILKHIPYVHEEEDGKIRRPEVHPDCLWETDIIICPYTAGEIQSHSELSHRT